MHVTKLTHIASGATAYRSASRASVKELKNTKQIDSIRITFGWSMAQIEPMHVTKLTHIASGATTYGSASRASVEIVQQNRRHS